MSASEYAILSMFERKQDVLIKKFNRMIANGEDYSDISENINDVVNNIINIVIKIMEVYKCVGNKEEEIGFLLDILCDEEEILEICKEYTEKKNYYF